jgi:hypothetical protein
MLLFDFIKDIIYRKKGDLLDNIDNEQEFQPYIVSRWLSMYSPDMAKIINLTTNRLYPVYNNKKEWYQALLGIIPKTYYKRIKYIKKKVTRKEQKQNIDKDKDKDKVIEIIARNKQISKREVEYYIKEYDIDIKKLKV